MTTIKATAALLNAQKIEPIWDGLVQLKDIIKNPAEKLVLHAGPPFASLEVIPAAVKNSILLAIQYEGWAQDKVGAETLLAEGKVTLAPAQDYDAVVPLAGVITPSMYLLVIADKNNPANKRYAVLNEGMTLCTRVGVYNEEIIKHLKWLNQNLGRWLANNFKEPVLLAPILQQSLLRNDDGHGRTMAASALLVEVIESWGLKDQEAIGFLRGALAWSLNYWMGMSALILGSFEAFLDKKYITKVGGNGYEFGLQLSTKPGVWLTTKAPEVRGNKEAGLEEAEALGAIGDSALVDFLGLGGQVLDIAQFTAKNLGKFIPEDYMTRVHEFTLGPLPVLGGRTGIADYDKILSTDKGPLVVLGMISQSGEKGRIGGGVAAVDANLLNQLQ
ncbi:hypothetical protein OURE66S_02664 [Oligella ureolytica]|jgi:hypothetical protein|nr:DUF1116 domain-containing protein [Oligella sp.]